MKNLITRALTGLIYVTAIVSAIYIHPFTFLSLFALIVGLGLWEYYGMVWKGHKSWHKYLGIAGGIYLFAASFFYAGGYLPGIVYFPYILFLLSLLVAGLYHKTENPVQDWALALFGQFYCAGLLSFVNFILFDPATRCFLPHYVLLIFIFIWLNDTGAYLIGTMFGKHKLFVRISPKKSWEGFIGGLIVVLSASQLIASYYPAISWFHWLALALIIVVFGTWGDLIESLIKRTFEVKDSGTLLPGHGGILDRLDSAILASPAVYIYIEFFIRN